MAHIDRLQIQRFRGITQELTLDFPKKKINIIFGENGSGKTSIIDAIDYITNKNLGSIKDKRAGVASNLPSLNAAAPAEIRLKSLNKEWHVSIGKGTPKITPEELMGSRILRRSNVQRFIEATASDKFAEVKHLLGIETVEFAETSIRESIKHCAHQRQAAERSYADTNSILNRSWDEAGRPNSDANTWAKSLSSEAPASERDELGELLRNLHLLQQSMKTLESTRTKLALATQELESAHAAIRSLPSIGQYDAISLGRLIGEAEKFLSGATSVEACPVCQQPITPAHLVEELQQRREELRQYADADETATHWNQKSANLTEAANLQEQAVLKQMHQLNTQVSPTNSVWEHIESIDDPSVISSQVNEEITKVETLRKQSTSSKAILSSLEKVQEASEQINRLKRMETILNAIETRMREERHAHAQTVLEGVREECNRIYQEIHPNEKLGFSSISIDPTSRASLIQKGSFADSDDISPQALYSEGHLDTLGFSFWLAHCKMESLTTPGKSVIVIDDVFSSVDAEHLNRIVNLLFTEQRNFAQIILATHSRSVLEAFSGARGDANKVNIVELNSFWNPGSGTRVNTVPAVSANLRSALDTENFDRQKAASLAGIALERVALKVCEVFRVPLPYLPRGEYELSLLMDKMATLTKTLHMEHPDDTVRRPIALIVGDVQAMKLIRNQVGAHFNTSGMETSDRDVHRFATAALEFVDFATCSGCGAVPDLRDGSNRYRCRCPKEERTFIYLQ